MSDATNCKRHYQQKKQNQSNKKQVTSYQPNISKKLKTDNVKSDTIEHPKTSPKLTKTIRQVEKFSQLGSGKRKEKKQKTGNILNERKQN